jgi:hypothetical protein
MMVIPTEVAAAAVVPCTHVRRMVHARNCDSVCAFVQSLIVCAAVVLRAPCAAIESAMPILTGEMKTFCVLEFAGESPKCVYTEGVVVHGALFGAAAVQDARTSATTTKYLMSSPALRGGA